MRTSVITTLFIIINTCFTTAWSQTWLAPEQVKEILISTYSGGLIGHTYAGITVVPEAGKWHSYIIRKSNDEVAQPAKSYDSILYRPVAVLNTALLNDMLNGATIIKPVITPSTFNITAQNLIAELKSSARAIVTQPVNFGKLINQQVIDSTIKKLVVNSIYMDALAAVDIRIVSKQNDTLKISTRNFNVTKLPWTVGTGKQHTYNMNINNFVLAAMGNENLPNKDNLTIGSLKESIFKYIDEHNTGAPIATYKWRYAYPESLSELEQHFTIKQRFLYGDMYTCTLKTMYMPENAFLEANINMTSQHDIKMVVEYAALIDQYFKAGNFVLNYYSKLPDSRISFSCNTSRSPYTNLKHLREKLPAISQADSTQVISFWASVPDDTSKWVVFPDNKTLLTYHSVTTPNGQTAPIYPHQPAGLNWREKSYTFYLFDKTGKVIAQAK